MTLGKELATMQTNYGKRPLKTIHLKRPVWLRADDPMSDVYKEKTTLLQKGNVVYAHIVQANTILFKFFPHMDCPAQIIYSTNPCIAKDFTILRDVAYKLYNYKGRPLDSVPPEWREIARVITDEHERSEFTFSIEYCGQPIEFRLIPTMIFRKLLPKRKLCGNFLPILTTPGCKSILVLPKKYWSKEFKKLWIDGTI